MLIIAYAYHYSFYTFTSQGGETPDSMRQILSPLAISELDYWIWVLCGNPSPIHDSRSHVHGMLSSQHIHK